MFSVIVSKPKLLVRILVLPWRVWEATRNLRRITIEILTQSETCLFLMEGIWIIFQKLHNKVFIVTFGMCSTFHSSETDKFLTLSWEYIRNQWRFRVTSFTVHGTTNFLTNNLGFDTITENIQSIFFFKLKWQSFYSFHVAQFIWRQKHV